MGFQLGVFSFQFGVDSFQLGVSSYELLVTSYRSRRLEILQPLVFQHHCEVRHPASNAREEIATGNEELPSQ